MHEIGPLMGQTQVRAHEVGHAWQLALDGKACLEAEYDPQLDRLVCSGVIGPLPQCSRLAICEILLEYNAAWAETGGIRMALDRRTDRVLMLMDLPAAPLHAGLLAEALGNMADIQAAWREILEHLATATATATDCDEMQSPHARAIAHLDRA